MRHYPYYGSLAGVYEEGQTVAMRVITCLVLVLSAIPVAKAESRLGNAIQCDVAERLYTRSASGLQTYDKGNHQSIFYFGESGVVTEYSDNTGVTTILRLNVTPSAYVFQFTKELPFGDYSYSINRITSVVQFRSDVVFSGETLMNPLMNPLIFARTHNCRISWTNEAD